MPISQHSYSENALGNAMRQALAAKDLVACQTALDTGADPNATFGTAGSYVTFAIETGFTEGAILLLDRGAHVEAAGVNRRAPLFSAARMGNVRMCVELLDRGAHISGRSTATVWPVGVGATALHEAARKGRVAAGRYLLERGAELHALDNLGHTPLHGAVTGNEPRLLEMTQMLLDVGADPDFTPAGAPATYLTPFQWALTGLSTAMAELIIGLRGDLPRKRTLAGKDVDAIASVTNKVVLARYRAAVTAGEISAALGGTCTHSRNRVRAELLSPL